MTSTPVKDVGSLMNFVGNRAAVTSGKGVESADSFGSVMNKASENRQNMEDADSVKDSREVTKETRVDRTHTRPKTKQVEETEEQTKPVEVDETAQEAASAAGEQMVKEIAEVLGVSEEEILDAMEELGFGMTALLSAENLTQLVLTISGGDSVSLLTDGGLYDSLQTLLQSQQEILTGLAEDFSMSMEDLDQLLDQMNIPKEVPDELGDQTQMENPDISGQDMEGEPVKVTVTVEEGTQSVKLSTDENGNVKQVETVVSKETESQSGQEDAAEQHSQPDHGNEKLGITNPLLDNVLQNKIVNAEVSFEQTAAYLTADTENIMNQIMDYMKIQLSPGMDQLEMQLHPESLGTVRIQLTSQGGEITAQFQVQNEAVKAVIESQIVELKEALKNQGVVVEAVEVSAESHAFESNLWQGQGREENASYQGNRKSPRRINLESLEEGFEEMASEEEILAAKMMEANGNTVDYTA